MSERQRNFSDACCECGICCKNARPPITPKRREIIEEYLRRHTIPIEKPFECTTYTFPREDDEDYCIFYDKETRKCKVHSVKPETCVAGPITFDISTKTQKIEWHLKMEKICPLAGRLYKDEETFQKHLKSAKKEIMRLVRELDSEALKAILRIEEPDTFKVDEDNIGKEVLNKITDRS